MCKEYFKNTVTVRKTGSISTVHVNYSGIGVPSLEAPSS